MKVKKKRGKNNWGKKRKNERKERVQRGMSVDGKGSGKGKKNLDNLAGPRVCSGCTLCPVHGICGQSVRENEDNRATILVQNIIEIVFTFFDKHPTSKLISSWKFPLMAKLEKKMKVEASIAPSSCLQTSVADTLAAQIL